MSRSDASSLHCQWQCSYIFCNCILTTLQKSCRQNIHPKTTSGGNFHLPLLNPCCVSTKQLLQLWPHIQKRVRESLKSDIKFCSPFWEWGEGRGGRLGQFFLLPCHFQWKFSIALKTSQGMDHFTFTLKLPCQSQYIFDHMSTKISLHRCHCHCHCRTAKKTSMRKSIAAE